MQAEISVIEAKIILDWANKEVEEVKALCVQFKNIEETKVMLDEKINIAGKASALFTRLCKDQLKLSFEHRFNKQF